MIGILFATIREAQEFLKQSGVTPDRTWSCPFFMEIKRGNTSFIVSISGIGIEKAKVCIGELLRRYPIHHVYNIGICGMVHDSLNVNALYSVSKTFYWSDRGNLMFTCDPGRLNDLPPVVLATCKKPVFDSVLRKRIAQYADIVDMEGAAIAQECGKQSIPCTLLKGVSDTADTGQVEKLYENIDSLSVRMAHMIKKVVVNEILNENENETLLDR